MEKDKDKIEKLYMQIATLIKPLGPKNKDLLFALLSLTSSVLAQLVEREDIDAVIDKIIPGIKESTHKYLDDLEESENG